MSEQKKENIKMKDGLEYSPSAVNQAMREASMVSALANQWAVANIPLGVITNEQGKADPAAIEDAANAAFLFAAKMADKSDEYFGDAVERIENEIIENAARVPVERKAARKTDAGLILPTGNMMLKDLRPDQKDFLSGGFGG